MFANIIAPDTLSRRQARTQPTSTEGDKSKGRWCDKNMRTKQFILLGDRGAQNTWPRPCSTSRIVSGSHLDKRHSRQREQ